LNQEEETKRQEDVLDKTAS